MPYNTTTLADIISASWSLELDSTANRAALFSVAPGTINLGPGAGIGGVVQNLDDINQCIIIILTTIPGEDPFRPTFGCNLFAYIDQPVAVAMAKLSGLVTNALATWEPRINVLSVTTNYGGANNPGLVQVKVVWQLKLPGLQPYTIGGTAGFKTTLVEVNNLFPVTYVPIIGTDDSGNPITGDTGTPATT